MEIQTSRFGTINVEEDKIITFVQEILGFPKAKRFVLLPHRENSPFYWLQCLDQPDLAFVVISPAVFVSNYTFDLPDNIQKELELERAEDVVVLVIVTIERKEGASKVTANLLGPIVINEKRRLACQVVLNPNKYPVQFPLTTPSEKGAQGRGLKGVLQKAASEA